MLSIKEYFTFKKEASKQIKNKTAHNNSTGENYMAISQKCRKGIWQNIIVSDVLLSLWEQSYFLLVNGIKRNLYVTVVPVEIIYAFCLKLENREYICSCER